MSHTETLRELISLVNDRKEIDVARYFTPDFRLDQPGGVPQRGHAGARAMLDAMLALGPDIHVTVLDMLEDGDRVAVRYQCTSEAAEPPLSAAMIAIYRFVDGRIAEDWGVSVGQPWQT